MKILLITLLLLGCGNHTKVEYHIVTQEELKSIANATSDKLGYAAWEDWGYVVYCDIYLLPEYPSKQCYDAVVAHELRHCYEFNFHADVFYQQECY